MSHRFAAVFSSLAFIAACQGEPSNAAALTSDLAPSKQAGAKSTKPMPSIPRVSPANADALRHRSRGVTVKDYESLITQPPGAGIHRAEVAPAAKPAKDAGDSPE